MTDSTSTFDDAPATRDERKPPPVAELAPLTLKVTGAAFWATMRAVVLTAMGVDIAYFGFFLSLGVPELAWPNLSSVALYGCAYLLILRRSNRWAIALVWLEVLLHSAAGSYLIGWDSGFHYYLLLFVPMIGIGSRGRPMLALVTALLVFYLGLYESARLVGPSNPIDAGPLMAVRWFNIVTVFAMFIGVSRLYIERVRRAERQLLYLATHDPVTGLMNRRQFTTLAEHELARRRRSMAPMTIALVHIGLAGGVRARAAQSAQHDSRLLRAGHLLRKSCRAHDLVGSWGPNLFIVLQPDTASEQAAAALERARGAVQSEGQGDGAGTHEAGNASATRVHIGLAEFGPADNLAAGIAQAERALARDEQRSP